MSNVLRNICLVIPVLVFSIGVYGQEIDYDSLLQRIDTVENPVYKPVVSLSYGVLNYMGDVRNTLNSPVIGNSGGMLNVATFVDNRHFFVANFNFMMGTLGGNEYSSTHLERNLNFRTSLSSIGVNLEYRFGHWFPKESLVRPYVTLGVEQISFSAKGDLEDSDGNKYYYWPDGTIRNVEWGMEDPSMILYRDYSYETDLRLREQQEFGLGTYSQRSLSIPAGLGLHFRIDRRAFFSLGTSYHYTLTDVLDNVAYEGTSIQGKKGNDSFLYTHLSFHFDLFSDPETRRVELMFADVEFDPLFYDDEDGDFVLDITDRCPGTPYGVEVDSLGCPLDGDLDGVPDYLDQERSTFPGAWVDETGVTLTEEQFLATMQHRKNAMDRKDVESYLNMIESEYTLRSATEIPERFKTLDEDGDGYLSFEELLKTVDEYFDYQLEISLDELREVNEFFFSQ